MTGQKQRIINRFRKIAKDKDKEVRDAGLNCICGSCNLAKFSLKEIEKIIHLTKKEECLFCKGTGELTIKELDGTITAGTCPQCFNKDAKEIHDGEENDE